MKTLKTLFVMAAAMIATTCVAQDSQPTNAMPPLPLAGGITNSSSLSKIFGATGGNVGQVASDGYQALAQLSWKRGVDVAIVALRHDGDYGAGIIVSPASTNLDNPVRTGFGVFALQNTDPTTLKKKLDFYDAVLTLSYNRQEVIPILELPVNVILGTGPAIKLNGGKGILMEQSEGLFEYTFYFNAHNNLTTGGGIIHCSGLSGSGIADAFYLRYEYLF